MFITIFFILFHIIYGLSIDVSTCMDVRFIGCWSPVVTSFAYIFTVYMSCYHYFVSDMYCIHQMKTILVIPHVQFLFILPTFTVMCVYPLSYLIIRPLEVVSCYRDPQLQVGDNCSYVFNLRPKICKCSCLNTHFIPNN